jgi:hypothetical protein
MDASISCSGGMLIPVTVTVIKPTSRLRIGRPYWLVLVVAIRLTATKGLIVGYIFNVGLHEVVKDDHAYGYRVLNGSGVCNWLSVIVAAASWFDLG